MHIFIFLYMYTVGKNSRTISHIYIYIYIYRRAKLTKSFAPIHAAKFRTCTRR